MTADRFPDPGDPERDLDCGGGGLPDDDFIGRPSVLVCEPVDGPPADGGARYCRPPWPPTAPPAPPNL